MPQPPDAELGRRFDRALEEGGTEDLREMVRIIVQDAEDPRFAEVCVARLARHRNALVRGDALAAFGRLAQRFGRLDRRRVQRLVENGLHAHHEYVREQAASAADDLETHLAWRLERPGRA
jgi:hypothetical protein